MQTLSFRVVVGLFALAVIVIAPACNESPPEISSGLIGQSSPTSTEAAAL
jgi:hypothetical protein